MFKHAITALLLCVSLLAQSRVGVVVRDQTPVVSTLYIDMSTKSGALSPYPTYNFDAVNLDKGSIGYDTTNAAAIYTPAGYSYGMVANYTVTTAPFSGDINNYAARTTIPEGALLPDLWMSGYIKRDVNSGASAFGQGKILRWIDSQTNGCGSSVSDVPPDCFHGVLTTFQATDDGDTTKSMQLTFANHAMNAQLCFSGCSTPENIISSVSRSGTTVTVTTSSPHGWLAGEQINITSCSDTTFNATGAAITPTDTTHFTYTAGTGTATSTGCVFFNNPENGNFYCAVASSSLCTLQWGSLYKITLHLHFGTLTNNQTAAGSDYAELYVQLCTVGATCSGIGTDLSSFVKNSSSGLAINVSGAIRLRPVTIGFDKSVTQIYLGNQWDVYDVCGFPATGGTPVNSGRAVTSVSQSGTTVTVNTTHSNCTGTQAAFLNGWSVEIANLPTAALNQKCTNVVKVTQDQFTCTSAVSQTLSDSSGTGGWRAMPDVTVTEFGWKLGTSSAAVSN